MNQYLVEDWMTRDVVTATPDMPMLDAHHLMRERGIRRLPVLRNGRLVGILTDSDVRSAQPSSASSLDVWEMNYLLAQLEVRDVMTSNVLTVRPADTVSRAAELLHEHRIGALPVIEEDGRLVGIITESDIFRVLISWFGPESEPPLVALFRHNLWANLRLLDCCATLDEQQLATTTVGTFGSVYNTLRHIVGAEQGYLIRLTGRQPENPLRREDNPDVAELRTYARNSGEGLIAFAASVTPAQVVQLEWDGKRWPVPASLILTQAINHATEHRSQVMTILTQQGVEPPDLSGWAYVEEHVTPTPLEQ